ncbi:MAG: flippase-like domain-containing protein [Candidatus Kerfeldbacteria bacterium]|nr:flippase-like domain-containing protein [Candidatus Kerfeldbacteria bacterium]
MPVTHLVKRALRILMGVIVAASICVPLFSYWTDVRAAFVHLKFGHLSVAFISMVASFLWLAWCWHRLAKPGGFQPGMRQALFLYSQTALIRYIPGNIFGLAAKALMMRRWGVRPQQAMYLMVYESGVLLWSGMITFFLVSFLIPETALLRWLIGILCFVAALFLFYPMRFVQLLYWIKPSLSVQIVPDQSRVTTVLTYLGYWALTGLSFAYGITAAGESIPHHLLQSIGIFAVSWVIGFLVLITPSGVGIREWCMVLLLQQSIPIAIAITIAFVARIIFIFSELVAYGLTYLIVFISSSDVRAHDNI